MFAKPFFWLFLILSISSLSFSINVVSPKTADVKAGDIIDLGTIGPGQTVSILIDRKATEGGLYGKGGLYDLAIAEELPRGWTSVESKLYSDPLQVTITADPDAPEGNYTAAVTVIDENNGEKLGNITFMVKVRITYDIMDVDVFPTYRGVGPGQPARFTIKITNKGSTGDVFQVSTTGMQRWDFTKQFYVPAQSTKTYYYEIVGNEEENYQAVINIQSVASRNIAAERNVTLSIRSDLIGDLKATNNGVVVFPLFEAPIYAIAGLLSNLFG